MISYSTRILQFHNVKIFALQLLFFTKASEGHGCENLSRHQSRENFMSHCLPCLKPETSVQKVFSISMMGGRGNSYEPEIVLVEMPVMFDDYFFVVLGHVLCNYLI
jgi:hypothetical protein